MESIRVYWNNITLLRRAEEIFINEYLKTAKAIKMEYFGLGTPRKIRAQVTADVDEYGEPAADIIVSSDFDIFQDARILSEKFDLFSDLSGEFDIRKEIVDTGAIYPIGKITVALALPMVICVNEEIATGMRYPESLKDLCKEEYKGKIILGSNDLAAGRTIVMNIWYLYGEEYALRFLQNAIFVPIPSMAYNYCSIKKEFPICILPMVLAAKELKIIFPSDGCPVVPSYVCVRKNVSDLAMDFLNNVLFGLEMQQFYSERGIILPARADVKINDTLYEDNTLHRMIFPDFEFRKNFDMTRFSSIMDTLEVKL